MPRRVWRVVVILIGLTAYTATASLCPSSTEKSDIEVMQQCSVGKSVVEWGKCMECAGACKRLATFETACVLGYAQIVQVAAQQTCGLDATTCNTPFREVLNSTCTAASESTAACGSFPLVPVVAGSAGGAVVLAICIAGLLDCRRRKARQERQRRKQKRAAREASASGAGVISTTGKPNRWRPSFVMRTKAVVNEVSKHTSMRLAHQSGVVANSGLSPMSSNGAPQLVAHNSFRGPPPGPPPAGLASHSSFRSSSASTSSPVMVAHNSFRGPPPGAPPTLSAHNSFRSPSSGSEKKGSQKTLVTHGSVKSMKLEHKGSFRGPPPIEAHPNFPQMQQQNMLASHNSFHGAPQMQSAASFHGAPMMMQGAPMGMQQMPPAMVGMLPPQSGPAPLPPPSRASSALTVPASNAPPPVPPSRNSGAMTNPAPSPAPSPASASPAGGGEENSLLAQIKAGKQLKKTQQPDADKKPAGAEEKKKPAGDGGGGGGLMAELQKKMRKKRGSVVE